MSRIGPINSLKSARILFWILPLLVSCSLMSACGGGGKADTVSVDAGSGGDGQADVGSDTDTNAGDGGDNGDGGDSSDGDESPPPETTTTQLKLFEGSTYTPDLDTPESYELQQISGPPVELETLADGSHQITLPWLLPSGAVVDDSDNTIELSATDSSTGQIHQYQISLINRRYLVFEVEDTSTESIGVFLRYIAEKGEDGVYTAHTVSLAELPAGKQPCPIQASPSGEYIAFAMMEQDGLPPFAPCQGLYLVNIDTQQMTKISVLDADGNDIVIKGFSWSPDGEKINYFSDLATGIAQNYVYDLQNGSTSYLNYGSNDLAGDNWPGANLYPIADGGNTYDLDLVSNAKARFASWLDDSSGLAFTVNDDDTGDEQPYLASLYGDARELGRGIYLTEQMAALDEEALQQLQDDLNECPVGGVCAAEPLQGLPLVGVDTRFRNPHWLRSSVSGQLAFIADVYANVGVFTSPVLAVHRQVVAGEDAAVERTPIEALEVYDAAWSPVADDLAFASGSGLRHSHSEEASDEGFDQLLGNEIPGQLYIYNHYQYRHQQPQERLSNPVPEIDDNYVRALRWSPSGDAIAYVRGEADDEGHFYTSLWLVTIDQVRDESDDTIAANNHLLANYRGTDMYNDYLTDFMWAPNGAGVLAIVREYQQSDQSSNSLVLRYFPVDGTAPYDLVQLKHNNDTAFSDIKARFSPQGDYLAFEDAETDAVNSPAALFVRALDSTASVQQINPSTGIYNGLGPWLWTPPGGLISSYKPEEGGEWVFEITDLQVDNQALQDFFSADDQIKSIVAH